jgi:hypothetical protein
VGEGRPGLIVLRRARRLLAARAAAAAAALVCAACSAGSVRGSADDAASGDDAGVAATMVCSDVAAKTGAPTYDAVYCEILGPSCSFAYCHGGSGDFLQLGTIDLGYPSLVNAPAEGPACAPTGLKRVTPGKPYDSLMFLKFTDPPCGSRMPLSYGFSMELTRPQVDQIGQWIACGALPGDAGCPADAGTFSWDGSFGDGPGE